jgi:hypothetical protein
MPHEHTMPRNRLVVDDPGPTTSAPLICSCLFPLYLLYSMFHCLIIVGRVAKLAEFLDNFHSEQNCPSQALGWRLPVVPDWVRWRQHSVSHLRQGSASVRGPWVPQVTRSGATPKVNRFIMHLRFQLPLQKQVFGLLIWMPT